MVAGRHENKRARTEQPNLYDFPVRVFVMMVMIGLSLSPPMSGQNRKERNTMVNASQRRAVQQWLAEAPFDNPKAMAAHPDFSYETWLERGRHLSGVGDVLAEILGKENLKKPSENAERAAYAIGWLGDKRAVSALLR